MHTTHSLSSLMQRALRAATMADSVLAWHHLRELGIDHTTLRRWMAIEFAHRMHRGAYLIGTRTPTFRARLRAAMYRGGRTAHVAGLGALYLARGIERQPSRIALVTTTCVRSFDGVDVTRTTSFPQRERCDFDGIRATSAARAIADLAPHHPPQRLVRWMRNAAFHGHLELNELRASEHRLARRGHGRTLRDALREFDADSGGTDSALEDLLISMIAGAGLPAPKVGQLMPGVLKPNERVDLLFEACGLVVEADGPHHLEETQRATDRRRDRQLRAAGYRVLRFWWYEIEEQPQKVLDAIRAALAA